MNVQFVQFPLSPFPLLFLSSVDFKSNYSAADVVAVAAAELSFNLV